MAAVKKSPKKTKAAISKKRALPLFMECQESQCTINEFTKTGVRLPPEQGKDGLFGISAF